MDVFLGLLLAVNNFSLDFDETLKLSQRSKKAFQGQSVCSLNESIDLFNVIFFLGGFVISVFLFSVSIVLSIYQLLLDSFHSLLLYVH